MALLDFLIDKEPLREQRERAIEFAEERYNPAQFSPQVDLFREQAIEGISEGQEDIARQRTVESLFRPTDYSIYGGQQQRAIAGQQARTRQQQQGLAEFESRLTEVDLQTQQQGRQGFAQARTQQMQTAAQRDAAIEEARMQYQAELDKRRQKVGSTLGKVAGIAAAAIPGVGPLTAGAIGAGAGGLLGGAVQGATSGLTTGMQFQGQQTAQQAAATQAPNVPAEQPTDQIIEDPLTQEQLTVGGQQQQRTVDSLFGDSMFENIQPPQAADISGIQQTGTTPQQFAPDVTGPSREMLLGDMEQPQQDITPPPQPSNISQLSFEEIKQGFESGQITLEQIEQISPLLRRNLEAGQGIPPILRLQQGIFGRNRENVGTSSNIQTRTRGLIQ